MTFEFMDKKVYYGSTTGLYIFAIFLGMFLDNLALIIEFITAFNVTLLVLIWPGYFYLIA